MSQNRSASRVTQKGGRKLAELRDNNEEPRRSNARTKDARKQKVVEQSDDEEGPHRSNARTKAARKQKAAEQSDDEEGPRRSNARTKAARKQKAAEQSDDEEGSRRRGGGKPWTTLRQVKCLEARVENFEVARQTPKKVGLKTFWRKTVQDFLELWPLVDGLNKRERDAQTDALELVCESVWHEDCC